MIGVDTNVLVRFFVRDDARQTSLAHKFMDERSDSDPAFVSILVIAELIWALGQIYGFDRDRIRATITLLLSSSDVVIEREDIIKGAVTEATATNADMADTIIAAVSLNAGCSRIMTFDRDAARHIAAMELLR